MQEIATGAVHAETIFNKSIALPSFVKHLSFGVASQLMQPVRELALVPIGAGSFLHEIPAQGILGLRVFCFVCLARGV